MTNIVVMRDDGSRAGDDIIDPILATVQLALARGDAELSEGQLSNQIDLTLPLKDIRLGETVRLQGPLIGPFTGKTVALSHVISIDADGNLSGETSITLKVYRASN